MAAGTANILLKYQSDIAKAVKEFSTEQQGFKPFAPGPRYGASCPRHPSTPPTPPAGPCSTC